MVVGAVVLEMSVRDGWIREGVCHQEDGRWSIVSQSCGGLPSCIELVQTQICEPRGKRMRGEASLCTTEASESCFMAINRVFHCRNDGTTFRNDCDGSFRSRNFVSRRDINYRTHQYQLLSTDTTNYYRQPRRRH